MHDTIKDVLEVFEHPISSDVILFRRKNVIERYHLYPSVGVREGHHVKLNSKAIGLSKSIQNLSFSKDFSMVVISYKCSISVSQLSGIDELFQIPQTIEQRLNQTLVAFPDIIDISRIYINKKNEIILFAK